MSVDTSELDRMPLPQPYLGVKDVETTPVPTAPPPKEPKNSAPPTTTPGPVTTTTTLKPWLTSVDSFPAPDFVNTSLSAVHVPANIYDGTVIPPSPDAMEYNSTGAQVQRVIELTEELEEVFHENWARDKTTSWQYFAHHTGVMRQYPASKWNRLYNEDTYDARVRPWYLTAAMSPKDVVILLDNSGSIGMTEPSLLTKQVVHNILNTLGPDDFVSVLLFNTTVMPLLSGLNVSLIPATPTYVHEMQHALQGVVPKGEANWTVALDAAFLLLEKYRADEAIGASCNQAVMVVTDVVPEHFEDLFRKHNRPRGNEPGTHARVFTFVTQDWSQETSWKAQWMACANQGWYMDIWKLESDEVLHYVPVMARPIMLAAQHPVVWSHMYADVTVPGMTNELWSLMQRDEQLRKVTPFCFKHAEVVQRLSEHKYKEHRLVDKTLGQTEEYVVTVSTPVRNMSARGLVNGDLLGVAAIDVPVSEMKRRIPHHLVGVNAYVFMVTNNGFIIFHPDLRPRFNGILKPGFNSVDMVDIELEDYPFPRNMSDSMRGVGTAAETRSRRGAAGRIVVSGQALNRVSAKASRKYWFRGVDNSPYSLVLAAPRNYTSHRIKANPDRTVSFGNATDRNATYTHETKCKK
ncbi:hypothetical protein ONE63_007783 [Megalurothrips usitatus]|uniref:VWFA domain-containing protein n=1 Tax=Megalurothrips usitatus TaxID=439358 RepID=A0AAV7XVA1_9NEOP|nr:hypothetical protein ONE63_007783 [Megalurothrips usitatus]